jgi:LPXTG-site transpeptidase (sortase) family protein
LLAVGGLAMLIGGAVSLQAWYAGVQWRASPQAAEAQRNLEAPQPIWITPAARATPTARAATARDSASTRRPLAAPAAASAATVTPVPVGAATPEAATSTDTPPPPEPTPTLGPSPLQLAEASFRFDDPPEPGAHADLSLSLHNPTDQAAETVAVLLPLDWLKGYRVEGTDPPTLEPPAPVDGALQLRFDGPAAADDLDIQVHVVTSDEVIDAPAVRVVDAQGRAVGEAKPTTEAPPAQPGPVYSLDIPKLHLRTGVVQVDWEPPLFVVGQVRTSAHVTEGNTVLVGHVRGAAGYNVFDHLDQLAVGDEIIASSRGQSYQFVVSETLVLPEADVSPTEPSAQPRLTLMTCTGDFNPLTRDYADRLWVIAEPPEAAAATSQRRARAAASPTPVRMSRCALLVAALPPASSPLSFEAAVQLSRGWLPRDAQPRTSAPEGNQQFIVERFSSAALAAALPAEWFTDRSGQPGDFLVVYRRRSDGRISGVAVGIGDDASLLLAALDEPR